MVTIDLPTNRYDLCVARFIIFDDELKRLEEREKDFFDTDRNCRERLVHSIEQRFARLIERQLPEIETRIERADYYRAIGLLNDLLARLQEPASNGEPSKWLNKVIRDLTPVIYEVQTVEI